MQNRRKATPKQNARLKGGRYDGDAHTPARILRVPKDRSQIARAVLA